MSGLQIIVTDAGRQALIDANNTGTLPVQIVEIGITDETFTPLASQTSLPGEIKRLATFAGQAVAADTLHVTIKDDGPDTYTLRGFGLYLQGGTLFAVYGQSGVILEKSTQATLLLAADVSFTDVDATALSFGETSWINPPATAETPGVVELATDAEEIAGADGTRASTPKGRKAALDSRFGAGAPTAFTKTLLAQASATDTRAHLGLGTAATRNEGAGNGLDADRLDGQEGSYYRNWNNLTSKPTSFPPATHGHAWSELSDIPTFATRWPAWSEVTGKPTSFTPAAHNHAASEITSGTFAAARIPNLDAAKITSGAFAAARIPNLDASKIVGGATNEPFLIKGTVDNEATGASHLSPGIYVTDLGAAQGASGNPTMTAAIIGSFSSTRQIALSVDSGGYLYGLRVHNGAGPYLWDSKVKSADNAGALGGQNGAYYLNWNNLTNKPASFTPAAHPHAAGDITSGTFAVARIPNLDAAKVTSGAFADARIPSLNASKVTAGTFADARIPTLSISKISGLQSALDAKTSTGASVTFNNITSNSGNHYTGATRHYFDKQVQANGGFKVYSSRRTKKDIETLQLGFDVLRKLRPVRYKYRKNICGDQRPRLGLIAEEVLRIMPEPVADDGQSFPAMDYDQLAAPIIGWLQQLDQRLINLEQPHA